MENKKYLPIMPGLLSERDIPLNGADVFKVIKKMSHFPGNNDLALQTAVIKEWLSNELSFLDAVVLPEGTVTHRDVADENTVVLETYSFDHLRKLVVAASKPDADANETVNVAILLLQLYGVDAPLRNIANSSTGPGNRVSLLDFTNSKGRQVNMRSFILNLIMPERMREELPDLDKSLLREWLAYVEECYRFHPCEKRQVIRRLTGPALEATVPRDAAVKIHNVVLWSGNCTYKRLLTNAIQIGCPSTTRIAAAIITIYLISGEDLPNVAITDNPMPTNIGRNTMFGGLNQPRMVTNAEQALMQQMHYSPGYPYPGSVYPHPENSYGELDCFKTQVGICVQQVTDAVSGVEADYKVQLMNNGFNIRTYGVTVPEDFNGHPVQAIHSLFSKLLGAMLIPSGYITVSPTNRRDEDETGTQ